MAARARTSRKVKAAAIAASLGAHLIFAVILVQDARIASPREPSPAVNIELSPPERQREPAKPPLKADARQARAAPVQAPPPLAVPPTVPPLASEVRPAETRPAAPTEDPALANARAAVREGFGCNPRRLTRLSTAEQEACRRHDRQYAAGKGRGVGAAADLDPDGRYVKPNPDEPYLARMPKQGCKPRVGGAGGDLSSAEHFVPGVTCVFKF